MADFQRAVEKTCSKSVFLAKKFFWNDVLFSDEREIEAKIGNLINVGKGSCFSFVIDGIVGKPSVATYFGLDALQKYRQWAITARRLTRGKD